MDWKAPPADGSKMWLNKSLELAIQFLCNWRCTACDAFSQFPTVSFIRKGTMTLDQLQHFADEMRAANAYFGRIRIMGGEPTIFPKIEDAVRLLHEQLVVPGYIGRLEMITNGSNPDKAKALKPWIEKIRVSDENDKQRSHTANLVQTPLSLGYQGEVCSSPFHCGIQLSAYGYFPCSSGSGIAKFRNDMQRWQRLTLPTCVKPCNCVRETWPDLADLCGHCYHALKPEHKIKCGTGMQPGQHAMNTPNSDAWQHLAPWLAGQQFDWPVYGAAQPAAALTS